MLSLLVGVSARASPQEALQPHAGPSMLVHSRRISRASLYPELLESRTAGKGTGQGGSSSGGGGSSSKAVEPSPAPVPHATGRGKSKGKGSYKAATPHPSPVPDDPSPPPLPPYPPSEPPSPPFAAAPPTHATSKIWCPGTCPVSPESLVDKTTTLLNKTRNGILPMSNATGIDTAPPKCDLCAHPYLFVASIGGRTGSTTVLNMLNSIPHIRLAGENGGQIEYLTDLYETAAHVLNHHNGELYCDSPNNEAGDCGAYQRGAVSPTDVLCDLQDYVKDIAVPVFPLLPAPQVSVRGFKDIKWSTETLGMLHTIFPCARIVYSVRTNNTGPGAVESYEKVSKACRAPPPQPAAISPLPPSLVQAKAPTSRRRSPPPPARVPDSSIPRICPPPPRPAPATPIL